MDVALCRIVWLAVRLVDSALNRHRVIVRMVQTGKGIWLRLALARCADGNERILQPAARRVQADIMGVVFKEHTDEFGVSPEASQTSVRVKRPLAGVECAA
jgi:hypothetical protein